MQYNYLIYQESLYAKILKSEGVITVVVKVAKCIRSKGLNHREFLIPPAQFKDVVRYSGVRWLSRGKMSDEC